VADQALSSLTNFALGVVVARAVAPAAFGSFTIVFATYSSALGLSRAITSEPLVVHYSAPPHLTWRVGTARATGVAVLIGIVLGFCCVVAGWIAAGALELPLIVLGAMLPGLLLQDCWRYAFFARGKGSAAFLNDLAWAIVLFPALIVVIQSQHKALISLAILAWGGAGTLAGLVGIWQSRTVPAPHRVLPWLRGEWSLIPRFMGECAAQSGSSQIIVYSIGAIVGLAGLGSLRLAQLVFGPVQVMFLGLSAIAVPELVRAMQSSMARLTLLSKLFSLTLAVTAVIWGGLALALPDSVGVSLLGAGWPAARPLAVAVMVSWIAGGLIAGAAGGLRALPAASESRSARVVGAALTVAGGVAGAAIGGAAGAAWGLGISGWIQAMVWWRQYVSTLRERAAGTGVGSSSASAPSGEGVRWSRVGNAPDLERGALEGATRRAGADRPR
jgi:uncharacterized integral membrane protein